MRLLLAIFAALAAMLLVAACGDDDDAETSGGSTAGEAATTTAGADLGLISDGTLTVASDIPYPPFEQGDPPDYDGFDIDLANAIADLMGLDVEIIDMPFNPILQGGNGQYDMAVAATTITPKRAEVVDFSDPYFEAQQGMLIRSGDGPATIEEVTSDTIVGAQDGTTGETYANDNTDAEVRGFEEIDDAYNSLQNGQVDAVFNDLPSIASVATPGSGLEVAQEFETGELYGIIFPAESDALREAVNATLQTVKDDGTLASIYQEWFGIDPPDSVLSGTTEPSS